MVSIFGEGVNIFHVMAPIEYADKFAGMPTKFWRDADKFVGILSRILSV